VVLSGLADGRLGVWVVVLIVVVEVICLVDQSAGCSERIRVGCRRAGVILSINNDWSPFEWVSPGQALDPGCERATSRRCGMAVLIIHLD
jgi:hypothetical protein